MKNHFFRAAMKLAERDCVVPAIVQPKRERQGPAYIGGHLKGSYLEAEHIPEGYQGNARYRAAFLRYSARKEGSQWLRSSRADTYFGSNHVADTLIGEQIQALTEMQMSHQYEGTKYNKKPISNVFKR